MFLKWPHNDHSKLLRFMVWISAARETAGWPVGAVGEKNDPASAMLARQLFLNNFCEKRTALIKLFSMYHLSLRDRWFTTSVVRKTAGLASALSESPLIHKQGYKKDCWFIISAVREISDSCSNLNNATNLEKKLDSCLEVYTETRGNSLKKKKSSP